MNNKIAYFVGNLNSYSGAAKQALLLAKNISKVNCIYIFNFDKTIQDKELRLIEKNIYKIDVPTSFFKQINFIYRIVKDKKIEIFHLHILNYQIILLGWILKKTTILKTTLLGGDDFNSKLKSQLGMIKVLVIKLIDYNIVLTKMIYQINTEFINSDKVYRIPNGIELPSQIFVKEKQNIFLAVGLVCERKNTHLIIEYFIKHYSNVKGSKLVIIGPNKKEDNILEFKQEYYEECLKLIKVNNMDKKIIFTGLLSTNETLKYLTVAKAILFFSSNEGMPNAVLEALSHNCVPITTNLNGTASEMFKHNVSGYIISNYDDYISINEIDKIIKSTFPYQRAKIHFDIRSIAKKYNELYLSILKNH